MADNSQNVIVPQVVDKTCPAVGYQKASVCVPVTVKPFANPLPTTTHCCGEPIIYSGHTTCPGDVNGACHFTITQEICVAVPVEIGAIPTVGAPSVVCGTVSKHDICTGCKSSDDDSSAITNCESCKNN